MSLPEQPTQPLVVPEEIQEVFREFRTCEFSTMTHSGVPVAWPLVTLWRPDEGCFLLTTSIGMPMKALNIRRDPRVSMLFSDPTASGVETPPAVLVQGDAEIPEKIHTSPDGVEDYWERIFRIQPAGKMYSSNALTRYFFDWYYMRLHIFVRPSRILWWPDGDFTRVPEEVGHVG